MSQRKNAHIKILEPEIVEMKETGKTKREIEAHFGLTIEQVKELLKGLSPQRTKDRGLYHAAPQRTSEKDASPRNIEATHLTDNYIHFYNHQRIQLKTGEAPLTLRHSA